MDAEAEGAAKGSGGSGSVFLVTPRDTFPPALGGAQWHWLTLACSAIHTLMGSGIWEVAKPSGAPI